MDVQITIHAELDDPDVLKDTLDILNKMLPYIFDNVVVTSSLHEYGNEPNFVNSTKE